MIGDKLWKMMLISAIVLFVCIVAEEHDHQDDYDELSGDDMFTDLIPDFTSYGCDNILLLQTIDGRLHAVDRHNGQTMWGERSIQLTKDWFPQYSEPKDDIDLNFMTNPTDGSLYYFDQQKNHMIEPELKKMGPTIPQMIESSPTRSEDGLLYTGDKKDRWQIIDPQTGEVLQRIDQTGSNADAPNTTPFMREKLFIGYTEYYLTIFDTQTNSIKWNLTYSEISAKEQDLNDSSVNYEVCSNCGLIVVRDSQGNEKWRSNFGFPIIGVYSSWKNGLLKNPIKMHSADFFYAESIKELLPTIYVGQYKQKFYVLPSSGQLKQIDPNSLVPAGKIVGHYARPIETKPKVEYLIEGSIDACDKNDFGKCSPKTNSAEITDKSSLANQAIAIDSHMQRENRRRRAKDKRRERERNKKRNKGKYRNPIKDPINGSDDSVTQPDDTPNNLPTEGYFAFIMATVSNVKFLQTLVLALILVLIITFSWNNIFNSGIKKIGRIEFSTEEFLGKGCLGTSVFRGTFDGRNVAVKRLLSDSFTLANREIELLRQAEHPNLLRYYCSESDIQFIYIALELCEGDLDFYIKNRDRFHNLEPRDILVQCASGLEHIHSLGVIHRDIKPSNILITYNNKKVERRAVIADFGLCRQVIPGRSSISVTGLHGTEGWAAPEVFTRDVKSVTFAVDVFSLGCVFYFILSAGKHPYGSEFFMRQARIRQGRHELENLEPLETELIVRMIRPEAVDRISIAGVLSAPLFWNAEKSLRFLSDTSDRLEREKNNSKLLFQLEAKREVVGGTDWRLRLETGLQEDLRKFRTYTDGIKDLLRAIRNKRHHQRDLTIQAKKELGSSAESFLSHWTSRFPMLLPVTFEVMCCSYAHDQDPIFDDFYELKTAKTTAKMIERDLVKQKQFPVSVKEVTPKNSPDISHLPYSHKIKTKLIWKDKLSPKNRRYNKLAHSTEPSNCKLLCGRELEIAADIPVRSGDDVICSEDLRDSFPVFLRMVESIKEEIDFNNEQRIKKEKLEVQKLLHERLALSHAEPEPKKIIGLPANLLSENIVAPSFIAGLPSTLPESKNFFQRGMNFVRQFSTSEKSEGGQLAREMVQSFLDDYDDDSQCGFNKSDLDEESANSKSGSDYEYDFGPIGTPKHRRLVAKKTILANEENDEIVPLIEKEPQNPDEEKIPEMEKKKPTRRKRKGPKNKTK